MERMDEATEVHRGHLHSANRDFGQVCHQGRGDVKHPNPLCFDPIPTKKGIFSFTAQWKWNLPVLVESSLTPGMSCWPLKEYHAAGGAASDFSWDRSSGKMAKIAPKNPSPKMCFNQLITQFLFVQHKIRDVCIWQGAARVNKKALTI